MPATGHAVAGYRCPMTNKPEDPDAQYDDETQAPGDGEPAPDSDAPAEPGSDEPA
jgi:hypothetical protein